MMSHRRSPIQHQVRGHNRAGVRIHKYTRGKGKRPYKNKPIRGRKASFSLTIGYPGEPSETIGVSAGTYTGAVREAFKKTITPMLPNRVTVRRL